MLFTCVFGVGSILGVEIAYSPVWWVHVLIAIPVLIIVPTLAAPPDEGRAAGPAMENERQRRPYRHMRLRTWPIVVLATIIGLAILLTLGTWQLQRLAWKNALIARANAAIAADPVPLDEALNRFLAGENVDYVKVKARGKFAPKDPLRLLSSANSGPAWELVQGFEQVEGSPVLVSRGKIAHNQPSPKSDRTEIEIVGHLVWHDQGRGYFDVDNKPQENLWFGGMWWP